MLIHKLTVTFSTPDENELQLGKAQTQSITDSIQRMDIAEMIDRRLSLSNPELHPFVKVEVENHTTITYPQNISLKQ